MAPPRVTFTDSSKAARRHGRSAPATRSPAAALVLLLVCPPVAATTNPAFAPHASSIELSPVYSANDGHVRFLRSDQWVALCQSSSMVARVACRQLGFAASSSTYPDYNTYLNGWYLSCSGNEARLQDCHESWSSSCYPARVRCSEPVRLVAGRSSAEGAVLIWHGGQWGALCSAASWSAAEADVVCRQLNLPPGNPSNTTLPAADLAGVTTAVAPIALHCNGLESQLLTCTNAPAPSDCATGRVAAVRCGFPVTIADNGLAYFSRSEDGGSTYPLVLVTGGQLAPELARVLCRAAGQETLNASTSLIAYQYAYGASLQATCTGREALVDHCTDFWVDRGNYWSYSVRLSCPAGARHRHSGVAASVRADRSPSPQPVSVHGLTRFSGVVQVRTEATRL